MIEKDLEQSKASAAEICKRRQYVAAIIINLSSLSGGMLIGWLPSVIPQLSSDNPPIGTEQFTEEEISWLVSAYSIMPIPSALLGAWLSERFGRKITSCCIAVPAIISWLLLLFAQNFYYLLVARILVGSASGLAFTVVPVYVAEISAETIRGKLGCYFEFGVNIGILSAFILGSLLSYHLLTMCGLVVPVIFFLTFIFMPETPTYLIRKDRIDEGTRSLIWLNSGDKSTVDRELLRLQQQAIKMSYSNNTSIRLRDLFRDRGTIKAFIISAYLIAGRQASGQSIVFNYSTTIFKNSKSSLSPHHAAIVLAVIQTIGSLLSSLTVERFGRRSLILMSSGIMMSCHLIFGIFFLLQNQAYDLSSFLWLPVVALSCYVLAYSTGVGAVAFVVAAEAFSPDVASLGIPVATIPDVIVAFSIMKFFPLVSTKFGSYTSFFLLSSFCACTLIITYFLLPETKGRSREAIFRELNRKPNRNSDNTDAS